MKSVVRVAAALTLFWGAHAWAAEIVGQVTTVIDGDDILVCSGNGVCRDIRLCGIDAPESNCPRYSDAADAMEKLVKGKQVRCVPVGQGSVCDGRSKPTNRNRIVAQCFQDGKDVAAAMVTQGLACDWAQFSGGHYSRGGEGRRCPRNHRNSCQAAQSSP